MQWTPSDGIELELEKFETAIEDSTRLEGRNAHESRTKVRPPSLCRSSVFYTTRVDSRIRGDLAEQRHVSLSFFLLLTLDDIDEGFKLKRIISLPIHDESDRTKRAAVDSLLSGLCLLVPTSCV